MVVSGEVLMDGLAVVVVRGLVVEMDTGQLTAMVMAMEMGG